MEPFFLNVLWCACVRAWACVCATIYCSIMSKQIDDWYINKGCYFFFAHILWILCRSCQWYYSAVYLNFHCLDIYKIVWLVTNSLWLRLLNNLCTQLYSMNDGMHVCHLLFILVNVFHWFMGHLTSRKHLKTWRQKKNVMMPILLSSSGGIACRYRSYLNDTFYCPSRQKWSFTLTLTYTI